MYIYLVFLVQSTHTYGVCVTSTYMLSRSLWFPEPSWHSHQGFGFTNEVSMLRGKNNKTLAVLFLPSLVSFQGQDSHSSTDFGKQAITLLNFYHQAAELVHNNFLKKHFNCFARFSSRNSGSTREWGRGEINYIKQPLGSSRGRWSSPCQFSPTFIA